MRLTLRTLLAYLDDVLEPAQTKEIGQKIQESPVAAALVSRVREVIRRRRLGAPDVQSGKDGIDPNIVAQYLDNTLREDRVADIERVCLESDVHLAEVAACHQILTLVLGEPLDLPQPRLDRFYALGPVPADVQLGGATEGSRKPVEPYRAPTNGLAPDRSFTDGLPDYLKPTPWPQRFAPAAGVAVLVIGAVLALALDPNLVRTMTGTNGKKEQPAVNTVPPAAAPPVRPVSPKGVNQIASLPQGGAKAAPAASDTPKLPMLPADIDPAPPADAPEIAAPADASSARPPAPLPATTRPMVPPAGEAVAAVTPPTPPSPAPQPIEPVRIRVPMQYTSTDGILIRHQRADGHWYVQPRRAELHPEEVLGCPEPFEAVFDLDAGRLVATLLGDCVVQILPATEKQRIRLELVRGRLLLGRGAASPPDAGMSAEIVAGNQMWTVELPPGRTRCALERQIVTPAGLPLPDAPNWSRLALFVAEGAVSMTGPNAPQQPIPGGSMVWLSVPAGEENLPTTATPEWLDPQLRNSSAVLRRYATLFEREFDPAAAVDLSIPALTNDPRPKISELATRCLGLTETYSELVRALVRSEHAEARAAAALGLRNWLIQDAERAAVLKQELSLHYPAEESTAVYRLLIGFTPSDARDRLTSLMIVEWLRSNFVEVRELAIEQLQLLTGRRYDYRPLGSPSQREPGIQRWLGHVDREGALVKPE